MVALKPILIVMCIILLLVESLTWRYIREILGLEYNDGVCNQKFRTLDTMNVTHINPVRIDKNCQQNCDYKNQTIIKEYLYYEDLQSSICCAHYYLSKNREKCIKCNVECTNAWCSSSNTCECDIGYTKDSSRPFRCYPAKCKRNCINGICAAEDLCICKKNYVPDPEDDYACIPICKTGFRRNPKDKSRCDRECYPPCGNNAVCEAGECACREGYDNVDNSCQPRCRPCDNNKICVAPHNCSCATGFVENNQGTCIPKCSPDCGKGVCTGPDVCTPICAIECKAAGQCRIQEKCLFDNTVIASHNRENCLNPELCLINCKCNNRDCVCDLANVSNTTPGVLPTITTLLTTIFERPYPSLPDIQPRIGNVSDAEVQTDSSNIVVGAAVAVVLVLGVAAAAGIIIRKRSKKSGRQTILNDLYRTRNSPGMNAVDIDNEIYEETNEYQVIGEKQ